MVFLVGLATLFMLVISVLHGGKVLLREECLGASLDACFAKLVHIIEVIGKLTQFSKKILEKMCKTL